ncbi:MAG TPA: PVC-type heme-binding CxxCH protein [Patescibacteria group bacterium]|nr:PVC-type heme-binding CxxCH protein [Patescibacteria group bacterium]
MLLFKKTTACFLTSAFCFASSFGQNLTLRQGDHISLLGNGLAEGFQRDGWLETVFQARFPEMHLVFRNLGFNGDEVKQRMRCENFGSPDDWLRRTRTDVVFAFFGYNESFGGPGGVAAFKQDLASFVQQTLPQRYDGTNVAQVILFSPVGHENLHDPNLPDGSANNANLKIYTEAIREVAAEAKVTFVDLFAPSLALYSKATKPLTSDGIHLNEAGHRQMANTIINALCPNQNPPALAGLELEKLREVIVNKDFFWYNRYRTVDGYNVYGGRSQLKYVDEVSNWDVLQREMEVLDVMTSNRDAQVWAAAVGKDFKVDDGNTPAFLSVKSNKPGPGPRGEFPFLDPVDAISHMKVGHGMKINLFASEKDYPDLAKPVQMAWDTQGRLWVAVWPSYPHWKPKDEMNDKLLVLEDTNGDGKADRCRVFADHLHCPTGFEFYNGGVLVAQAPDIIFLKDSTGKGKANVREILLGGIGTADTHHTANSFVLDPGGSLYFQEGVFHTTQAETPYGPPVRNANAAVYRYEPRTHKFETYVAYDFANPHGHVFDRWGEDFVMDGTGAEPYIGACFSGRTYFPARHKRAPKLYQQRTRPCPGMEILSSSLFPKEMQGNLLVANVIGFLGILQYKISDKDSGFVGTEVEPLVQSDDPNFRPVDIKIGPDGAIYFLEWQNPIIGHMQHHLRDPNRDHIHGRIYRITYAGEALRKAPVIAGQPVPQLLELLRDPEDRVRSRARIELSGRKTKEVMNALEIWMKRLDEKDPEYQHNLLEALWLYESHNVVNEPLLKRMLRSPEFRARAAATRVLCYWRDRVSNPLDLLKVQSQDDSARVRLEAVRACSFFTTPQAAEVALEVLNKPMDEYLKYTLDETMNTLDRFTKAPKP